MRPKLDNPVIKVKSLKKMAVCLSFLPEEVLEYEDAGKCLDGNVPYLELVGARGTAVWLTYDEHLQRRAKLQQLVLKYR